MDKLVAPRSVEELQREISAKIDALPKRLRQCGEFVLAKKDRIATRTVAELAQEAGVQPSAFMRFCQTMGFKGFSDMQRLYRAAYEDSWPDYAARLNSLRAKGANTPSALLAEFAEAGKRSIESLVNTVDSATLEAAVRKLAGARMIHIVGYRRSFPVATYLAYVFEKMDVPATLHGMVGGLETRHGVRAGDALLAISFAPYTPDTIELAEFVRKRGVPVIAITDSGSGLLGCAADEILTVDEADFGAFRSLSATLSLAVTLAVAVGAARGR